MGKIQRKPSAKRKAHNPAPKQGLGNRVGAYEAKTHFSEMLERVQAGEEFVVTKHGFAVARISPAKEQVSADERRRRVEDWLEVRKGISLGGLKIKDLISEGRR